MDHGIATRCWQSGLLDPKNNQKRILLEVCTRMIPLPPISCLSDVFYLLCLPLFIEETSGRGPTLSRMESGTTMMLLSVLTGNTDWSLVRLCVSPGQARRGRNRGKSELKYLTKETQIQTKIFTMSSSGPEILGKHLSNWFFQRVFVVFYIFFTSITITMFSIYSNIIKFSE